MDIVKFRTARLFPMPKPDICLRPVEDHPAWDRDAVVLNLRLSREVTHNIRPGAQIRRVPSRKAVEVLLDEVLAVLFPAHLGNADLTRDSIDSFVRTKLGSAMGKLSEQAHRELALDLAPEAAGEWRSGPVLAQKFAERLPDLRNAVVADLHSAYRGDPAATSITEILLAYPGVSAIIHYRLAHALLELGLPLIARLVSNIAHMSTGIDIHPGAEIGEGFFIDHGTGVVIGETALIGRNVRLYQAVTLGAKSFSTQSDGSLVKGVPRHPIVEDGVVIYAGATILGRITIGRGSIVGGNVWLTHSVPPGSVITQASSQSGGPQAKFLREDIIDGYGI
jgi:serine O-acetyltransferase